MKKTMYFKIILCSLVFIVNFVGSITNAIASESFHQVSSVVELKKTSRDTTGDAVFVAGRTREGDGGEGVFLWLAGNHQNNPAVQADTSEGIYVKPAVPGNGSTGVWVRQRSPGVVNASWYGHDTAAAQAAIDSREKVIILQDVQVTEALVVRTVGQIIQGLRGKNTVGVPASVAAANNSVRTVFEIHAGGVMLRNLSISGPGYNSGNSILIKGEDIADGKNSGDVDLYIDDCILSGAQTIAKITGRGFYVENSTVINFNNFLVVDWPKNFLPGDHADQKLQTGMRAYSINNTRFHAGSGGFLITNTGSNAANIHGIHFSGNYTDTATRIFNGVLRDSKFSGNTFIHLESQATALFNITGGSNSQITDNLFYGMEGEGGVSSRNILSGVFMSNISNLMIIGNIFKQVGRDVFAINEGCTNIIIKNNILDNVLLENKGQVARYPLRIGSNIKGLVFSENVIRSPSLPGNTFIVGNVAGYLVEDFEFGNNIYDVTEFNLHNFQDAVTAKSLQTSRKVVAYIGDGTASQKIKLPFPPLVVIVSAITGENAGKCYVVLVSNNAGNNTVDISGNLVYVKKDMNIKNIHYTIFAQ